VDGFELTTIKPSASTLTPVITLDHPDCRLTDFTISGYACPHAGETANATIAGPIKISTKGGKVDHCLFKGNVSKTNYTRGYAIMLYGGLMEQCVVRDNNITYTTAYAPVYINGGSAEVEMRNCLVTHTEADPTRFTLKQRAPRVRSYATVPLPGTTPTREKPAT
jgi:hypothetical protein